MHLTTFDPLEAHDPAPRDFPTNREAIRQTPLFPHGTTAIRAETKTIHAEPERLGPCVVIALIILAAFLIAGFLYLSVIGTQNTAAEKEPPVATR